MRGADLLTAILPKVFIVLLIIYLFILLYIFIINPPQSIYCITIGGLLYFAQLCIWCFLSAKYQPSFLPLFTETKKSTSRCFCKTFFFYSGSSWVVIILYLGRSHIVFAAYLSISPAGRLCRPGEKRKKQSNCDLSSAPLIAFVQQPWDLKYEQDYAITQRKYK